MVLVLSAGLGWIGRVVLVKSYREKLTAFQKQGQVLDYKVLTVADPRDNEPDLYLLVEWKNMAAFDTPLDQQDALTRKLFGSVADANKAGMDRESVRTLRGDMLTRELILK